MAGDYEVGYGRPPKTTRFKKGQSGNPKGRPKGSRDIATELREELDELMTVREGGRTHRISKQRALVKSLMAKALQGDTRAATAILAMLARVEASMPPETVPLAPDELALLRRYADRALRAAVKENSNE